MTELNKSDADDLDRIPAQCAEHTEVHGSKQRTGEGSGPHGGGDGAASASQAETPQAAEPGKNSAPGVTRALAPLARRQPPSFTRQPGVGRSRLLRDGNFVGFPRFAGKYEHDLLLPPGVDEQFTALKERLEMESQKKENQKKENQEKENQEKALEDSSLSEARWTRAGEQDRAERARHQKRLSAEMAEREERQAQEKIEAELRRMGLNPDQGAFRKALAKLPPTQRLQVYRTEDVQRLSASAQTPDADVKKRGEMLGYLLKARGPWRRLGAPESVEAILALEEDHPHFAEVIEFVANHVALQKMRGEPPCPEGAQEIEAGRKSTPARASAGKTSAEKARAGNGRTGKGEAGTGTGQLRSSDPDGAGAMGIKPPVRLPPMLLYGPPGVGKTHFCESLAKVLGVPVRRHPMDQAETSSALLGSDATWGNSRYGLVFDLLGLGDHANPLVILDELDKAQVIARTSGGLSSPTGVLHSLLEPVSAANVRDISLDLEMDASQITWIATANYPWWVSETLRSRFREFLIAPPDARQAIQLAKSVVKNALKAAGFGAVEPDRRMVVALAHLSAREIYQVTLGAAATAARRAARVIEMQDLPQEMVMGETGEQVTRTRAH